MTPTQLRVLRAIRDAALDDAKQVKQWYEVTERLKAAGLIRLANNSLGWNLTPAGQAAVADHLGAWRREEIRSNHRGRPRLVLVKYHGPAGIIVSGDPSSKGLGWHAMRAGVIMRNARGAQAWFGTPETAARAAVVRWKVELEQWFTKLEERGK